MNPQHVVQQAQAFVHIHYGPVLEGLSLSVPASIDAVDAAGWIVVVRLTDANVFVRVHVSLDGQATLAPPRPEEDADDLTLERDRQD